MKIVVIGGGKAASILIDELAGLEGYDVVGVVDPFEGAPGMQRARELGIDTGNDKASMIRKDGVSLVFELTGKQDIEDEIKTLLNPDQQMVSSCGAWVTCNLIDIHDKKSQKLATQIGLEFEVAIAKIEEALKGMNDSGSKMNNLLRHGHLISLNAKVEAARAGESGKAFSVVVDEVRRLVEQLKAALDHILSTSEITETTLEELRSVQTGLEKSFD